MKSLVYQIHSFSMLGTSSTDLIILSAVLTILLVFSVVLIGFLLNLIEKVEITLLEKIFGIKFALIFHNYLTFPGTLIHELSHALFCLLTGAKLKEICVFEDSSHRLGHVTYANRGPFILRAIQDSLIAAAPTIIGLILGFFIIQKFLLAGIPLYQKGVAIYLLISLLNHSSMSSVDSKLYIRSFWIFLLPLFLAIFLIFSYFLGTNL